MQTERSRHPIWTTMQGVCVVGLAGLMVGMVLRPDQTLSLFWGVAVPVLPASFLVSAGIWRGLCPLATLNMWSGDLPGPRRVLERSRIARASVVGMVLLVLLLAARHAWLNTDASVLAAVLAGLAILAAGMGLRYRSKAGFCNSLCPILPVEKLYGQFPLIALDNPRCTPCRLCTAKGCIDLDPLKAVSIPARRPDGRWTFTSAGAFAAAFPGGVTGYFAVPAVLGRWGGSVPGGPTGYIEALLIIVVGATVSWGLVTGLSRVFAWSHDDVMPVLAALAISIYYAFSAGTISESVGLGVVTAWSIRLFTWTLAAWWLRRARAMRSA